MKFKNYSLYYLFILKFSFYFTTTITARIGILACFRPRSSHTSQMLPLSPSWSLPLLELIESYRTVSNTEVFPDIQITSIGWPGFQNFRILYCANDISMRLLQIAAQRCVLLHGIYRILYQGNMDNDVNISSNITMKLQECNIAFSSYQMTCTIPDQPWLSKEQIDTDWNQKFSHIIQTYNKKHEENTTKSTVNFQIFGENQARNVFFCEELTRGIAAPLYSNQGGRDPLPLSNSFRRPLSGILNKFALKTLPYKSTTYMEPEIGLLMCSLVGITQPTSSQLQVSCLDPFCGSCSLLNYASYYGASTTIGVDINENGLNIEKICQNCIVLNISSPTVLYQGKAQSLLSQPINQNNSINSNNYSGLKLVYASKDYKNVENNIYTVDFIVTDPPYGMQDAILIEDNQLIRSDIGHKQRVEGSEYITKLLIQICYEKLKSGGKAVFMIPDVRSTNIHQHHANNCTSVSTVDIEANNQLKHLPEELQDYYLPLQLPISLYELPTGIRLHLAVRQQFTPTFSRWLVVLQSVLAQNN